MLRRKKIPPSTLNHNTTKANGGITLREAARVIARNRVENTARTTKHSFITAADKEEDKIADYKSDTEKICEQGEQFIGAKKKYQTTVKVEFR
eukprot:10847141-Ditylum_brightwellii.AAC.1